MSCPILTADTITTGVTTTHNIAWVMRGSRVSPNHPLPTRCKHTYTHMPLCHVRLQPTLQPLLSLTHLQTASCVLALVPQWDEEPGAQPPPGIYRRIAQLEHRCPPKWSVGGWGGLLRHYKTSEMWPELRHEEGRPWWGDGRGWGTLAIRKCLMGPGKRVGWLSLCPRVLASCGPQSRATGAQHPPHLPEFQVRFWEPFHYPN